MLKFLTRRSHRSSGAARSTDELHLRKLRKHPAARSATRADLQIRNLLDDPSLRRAMMVTIEVPANIGRQADSMHLEHRRSLDGAAA